DPQTALDSTYVEIDAPETQGHNAGVGAGAIASYAVFKGTDSGSNPKSSASPTGAGFSWDSIIGDDSYLSVSGADTGFHYYGMVWSAGNINFYLDGVFQGVCTLNVPAPSAYLTNIDCNHYGTNDAGFGGTWTSGTRYAYVASIKYWS